MKIIKSFLFIFSLIFASNVLAQEVMKHPRVVELEDRMNKDASSYVKARFPGMPFMAQVSIDPLRRESDQPRGGANERLPYFDPDDEEMLDEWDNPQVPLLALINRAKRIRVTISVPSKLREVEIDELKTGIFQVLHMVQARDEITVSKRDWSSNDVPWVTVYFSGALLFALLVGLLVINRTSANRIAKALSEVKIKGDGGNAGAAAPLPPRSENVSAGGKERSSELKVSDPIKLKEIATHHIEILMGLKNFPNHQDIFILEKLGLEDPEKLGAILSEFPIDLQKKMFAYSSDFTWIRALNEPGFLDWDCLDTLQTLTQVDRDEARTTWDHCVLAVWRLKDQRTHFIKSLSREEGMAVLSEMPKAIAVYEARRAYPGSWADILDPEFKAPAPAANRIKQIHETALAVLPLNNIAMVRRYRSEKELMEYLQVCDPSEERDVYGATSKSSMIHQLRPPFFQVFDQDEKTLQDFVTQVAVDQWALALFNTTRPERAKIEIHMSEKQRFLLIERLKRFDAAVPDKATIGQTREIIGQALNRHLLLVQTANNVIPLKPTENLAQTGTD